VGSSARVREPTPQLMGNVPKANTEEAKRWRYFEGFRRDPVVQLFLQKGAFWEAIREARSRNGIEAITSVPPSDFNSYVQQHPHDVHAILERVIPKIFEIRSQLTGKVLYRLAYFMIPRRQS
jgi:hypothetical protein